MATGDLPGHLIYAIDTYVLIIFNNKKLLDYLWIYIYPSQLTVEKANKSDDLADYLDLTFIIDSGGKLSTRIYGKHDDFDFHIVNLFLSSNIPSGSSHGVYIYDAVRTMMISDNATSAWLIDFCHKTI